MKKIIFFSLLCLLSVGAQAQNSARVTCYFEGTQTGDTAKVDIWKYNIRTPETRIQSIVRFKGQEVKVVIPPIKRPVYLSVIHRKYYNRSPELLLVEPGDDIHIYCTPDTMIFSGKGAAKMEYRYALIRLYNLISSNRPAFSSTENKHLLYNYSDRAVTAALELLENYRERISSAAYRILQADVFAEDMNFRFGMSSFAANMQKDSGTRSFYRALYQRFCQADSLFRGDNKNPDLAYSFYYSDYILKKLVLDSCTMQDRAPSIHRLYTQIKQDFSGKQRDHLITALLLGYRTDSLQLFNCLQDALITVKDAELAEVLRKKLSHKLPGSPAFDFSLKDASGKQVRLADFKGKTLILDFWYTGCLNCIEVSKVMETVDSVFSNNRNVVFISISIDRDKTSWLRSVQRGLYTTPKRINLYTNGKGSADPLIKYYDIHGYPTLMLIDKYGKLFTSTLPDPRKDKGRALILQVQQALAL